MFKNYELLLHPTFGVLGMLAAVWVFVEALNPTPAGEARMRTAARTGAVMTISQPGTTMCCTMVPTKP